MPKKTASVPAIRAKLAQKVHPAIVSAGVAVTGFFLLIALGTLGATGYFWQKTSQQLDSTQQELQLKNTKLGDLANQLAATQSELAQAQSDLQDLKNQDQYKRNQALQAEITAIQTEFSKSISQYEDILKLRDLGVKTQALDAMFSKTITLLSQRNYASASAQITLLTQAIQQQQTLLATAAAAGTGVSTANVPQVNDAPANGYRRQLVKSDSGTFLVDMIAADLNSTRVQVETASPGDCGNNCPLGALADFVKRSNGFAGVNGPYFCPAEYPSCAGKTNSFDTLLMNKNKVYFNSANNVYSIVPAVIFSGNSARFIEHSENWGRDTGVDAVIAGQPLLLLNGDIKFGGDGDPKKTSRTSRAFIGSKGTTVYIGDVHGASVVEMAHVLKAMGLQNGLNLDDAGSLALYLNGHYIAGPGRNTPFGIVLVRK